MGISLLQLLCLYDSSHRRLRKRGCGVKKIFGFRFVNVTLDQFVYLRVAESQSFQFNNSIYMDEVRPRARQPDTH